MIDEIKNTAIEISKFIFTSKNNNALRIVAAAGIDLTTASVNILAPLLVERRFSRLSDNNELENYELYIAGGSLLLAQLMPKFRNMVLNSVRANVQKELTFALAKKVFELELDHQLTERTGEFAQALSKNYSSIDKLIPSFFGEIAPTITEIMGTSLFLMLWYENVGVGLLQLLTLSVYLLAAALLESNAARVRNECMLCSYKTFGDLMASIGNYIPAHLFGNVGHELEHINRSLSESEVLFARNHRKDDANALILSIINITGFVGISVFAALVHKNASRFDSLPFILILYYMNRFNNILNNLAPAISSFHTSIVDAKKIADFIGKVSKVSDPLNALELVINNPPLIEFSHVSFSYKNKLVLKDISFSVQAGSKFAIVGATGSGKSTLLNLLLRFYKPCKGHIFVAGQDISTLSASSLRKQIAVVAQSSTLFNKTVKDNIQYGYLDSSDKEINEAAELAKLDIKKLVEIAGQGGDKLSGGEKQRTTIARAVLKGGPIYLLDEPTSALDPETEREIQNTLDELTNGATTIIVTHRLNTIVNAHHILYLKDGHVAEAGTFLELIEKKGLFFNQFQVQCQELGVDPANVQPNRLPSDAASLSFSKNRQNFWKRRDVIFSSAPDDEDNISEKDGLLNRHSAVTS